MKEEAICWKNPIIASGQEGSHLCFISQLGKKIGNVLRILDESDWLMV